MKRTSILLPPELRNRADRQARQMGISFGELVRRAQLLVLEQAGGSKGGDAFLADGAVHHGDGPRGVRAVRRSGRELHGRAVVCAHAAARLREAFAFDRHFPLAGFALWSPPDA